MAAHEGVGIFCVQVTFDFWRYSDRFQLIIFEVRRLANGTASQRDVKRPFLGYDRITRIYVRVMVFGPRGLILSLRFDEVQR